MTKAISILGILCIHVIHAQTWQPLGPFGSEQYSLKNSAWGGGTGQIHTFAFAPLADHHCDWYCGTPWGGIWKSVDEGAHWTDINPQMEQVAGICSANEIVVDPHSPSTIYVANGRTDNANTLDGPGVPCTGVFRSMDGGATFQHTGLKYSYEEDAHIIRLAINPYSTPGTTQLFAATDRGLYMSQPDPQKKWAKVFDKKIFMVRISPGFTKNHMVYASGDDIYVSRKEGAKNSFSSFEPSITDQLPQPRGPRTININVIERNGTDAIYALVFQDGKNYFLYFDGSRWEVRKPPVVSGIYIPTGDRLRLAVDTEHPDRVYVGITYVCRSDDGGRTWELAGRYCQPGSQSDPINIHGDIQAVEMIPGTNDILIGTDGGIFRYLSAEKKEIELNGGLNISQVIGMSAAPHAPYRIVIGKQDTGYDLFDGSQWNNFEGGDGFSMHASPIDTTIFIGNYGKLFHATTSRPSSYGVPSCKAGETALFSIVAYDPKVPERCFTGGTQISYTVDTFHSFTLIYKYHTGGDQPVDFDTQIEAMDVGHDDATGESVLYVSDYGFINGSICRMVRGKIETPKSGKPCDESICPSCWVKVPLPHEKYEWMDATAYSITGIAVSPSDPDELWVCYGHNVYEKDDLRVLHSTDGGASWSAMDRGLPPYTSCSAICYDPKTKFLYLGTGIGVYINDGSGWKPFGTGLPKVYVKAMEINQSIRKIRAGLYGRGVWELDLAN